LPRSYDIWLYPPQVTLTINDDFKDKQSPEKIWLSYKDMLKTVKEGSLILLDDGAIEVRFLIE
jgi:pyruvate kinase